MLAVLDDLDRDQPLEITLTVQGNCLCPFNHKRDAFTLRLAYVPVNGRVLELAAFAEYIASFSDVTISHEVLTQRVLAEVSGRVAPTYCRVETSWAPIEGVGCTVRAVAGE